VDDPSLARQYWTRLAEIQERLGHIEQAAESYEKVLALDPTDRRLSRPWMRCTAHRTLEDLVTVYRRRIDLEQGGTEAEALFAEMAEVYEEKLGRPEEAISAYPRGVDSGPGKSRCADGASRAFHQTGAVAGAR